jgi:nucleoside-diphosphate-sugar epimerase
VRGDLHDAAALRSGVAEADVVYHVAALTGAIDEAAFTRANRDGTQNLVDAIRASGRGPRLVLVSSMAAGGPARAGHPVAGDEPAGPVTMYGRSKLASEQVVRASGLPFVVVRPPTVYGPGDTDNFPALFRIASLGIAPVFGTGAMELSLVYVTDLADGLVLAGTTPAIEGRTFYVNHPEVVTSAELVRRIGRAVGKSVRVLPLPKALVRGLLAVTGTAASVLRQPTILRPDKIHEFFQEAWTGNAEPFMVATGWQPAHDLSNGLEQTVAWWRSAAA